MRDGDLDVVEVDAASLLTLGDLGRWFENDGTGNFPARLLPAGGRVVDSADLDGDSNLDLVVGGPSSVVWFKGDGNGAFTSQVIYDNGQCSSSTCSTAFRSLHLDDLDGDGDIDVGFQRILTPQNPLPTIGWLENDGSQSFALRNVLHDTSSRAEGVQVDVDRDGDIDIVSEVTYSGETNAFLFENDGSGRFQQRQIGFSDLVGGRLLSVGDLDGDGDVDVLAVSSTGNVWLENVGSQSFVEHNIPLGASPVSATTAGDINNDGPSGFRDGWQFWCFLARESSCSS